jgi:protocatechuate 3,4-dioxygenase beta subunit
MMESQISRPRATNLARRPAARRALLLLSCVLAFGLFAYGVFPLAAQAAQPLRPLGSSPFVCGQTLAVTEGPFYRVGSPERTNLVETGMVGARVSVVGHVYDTNCQPVPNAWLDFWQANYYGVYDNTGYTLRGHQYADQTGYFHLETIVPGEYTGRTIHIHVKVQAPGGPILTTQLFFPDVAYNNIDNIFDPSLVVALENTPSGKIATYNFVVGTALQSPRPGAGTSYTFKETGFTVSGRFWDVWQGGRPFQDSVYINGYPITAMRDEVSPSDGKVYRTQWFERARYELHPENQAPHDVLLGLLELAAVQGRQGEAPFKPIADPGNRLQWFAQTGHSAGDASVGGRAIAAYWSQRGDVRQFGLPLSQPFMETNNYDSKPYLVQYFERQRFEYHPEYKGTRYEMLLERLGAEQVGR